jgi:hypothetical protein
MKRVIVLGLLMLVSILAAQNPNFRPDFLINQFNGFDKIQMNHSMSFSSGISSNKQSFYMSTYTNHLTYNFNSKLDMKLDMNFVNMGTATRKKGIDFSSNNDNRTLFVPEIQLNYKPTDNTEIMFMFRTIAPIQNSNNKFNW